MTDPKVTYELLYRNQLTIDLRVQRTGDQNRQKKIGASFNEAALGELTVSRRDDGTNVLLDGQNRVGGAELADYRGPFRCAVHHGLTVEEEARLFLLLNDSKLPSAIAKYLVRVTMGDPIATGIQKVLDEFGWHVEASDSPGCIAAVVDLEQIYTTGAGVLKKGAHDDLLAAVIATVTQAWGHNAAGVNGALLKGIAQMFARFGHHVKVDKLIRDLQKTQPQVLIANGKVLYGLQGGLLAAAIAKGLVGMHNNGLRTNRLPEWVWTR